MQTLSQHKRGDTFSLACAWKQDGVSAPTTGFTIAAQIRKKSGMDLVTALSVVNRNDAAGTFTLVPVVSDTNTWPTGLLICDLQITNGTTVRSSESFAIPIIEDVTK